MVCKKSLILFLITILSGTSIWAKSTEGGVDDVTYDVVTITVKTSISDAKPEFARVKYNKLCPLSITSDDMGRGEFVRNWAFFNGYPVFHQDFFGQLDDPMTLFEAPYNATTLSWQEPAMEDTSWTPMTYTDGTGGVRRFTATSAILPYQIQTASYNKMNTDMAKAMVRTGWSFAQHDVADKWPEGVTTDEQRQAYIETQLPLQSNIMKEVTGYGLKVLVEPNGNKDYIRASLATNDICWNIFQNATTEYPALSKSIDDWTKSEQTTFKNKPIGAYERIFFQDLDDNGAKDGEKLMDALNPVIANKDGSNMILGGTHTIGNRVLNYIKNTIQPTDLFWVAGADEVWEYYHLYHNAIIENIHHDGTYLIFDVKIPRDDKSQFREMTINIPGVTDADGTDCTFSDNVVTGGAAKDTEGGRFVINFGIETSTKKYISQLLPVYRSHLHNEYLKRDIQYLIDLLVSGADKNTYQSQLDAEPNYSYTIRNSFGTTVLEGASDANDEVYYKYPRYILSENTLYEAAKNTSNIQNKSVNYVKSYTPTGTDQVETLNYAATAITGVSYYTEGEDITGVTIATRDFNKITEGSGEAYALRFASNGAAGEVKSPVTVTNIPKGKYTLVAAIGDTHTSSTAQFTFKVGDKSVLSLTTEDVSGYIKEYSKEGITIKTEQPLTIEAVNSGGSFWVDYLYLIKTGEYDESTPDVEFIEDNLAIDHIDVDMTDDSSKKVTITAKATAKGTAAITQTVIKNSNDVIVAESTSEHPTTCSYTFTPSQVGDVVFTAEATDDTENGGKTGLSDELKITVMSNFTLTATSNLGDNIGSITFPKETANKTYRFMYPRFILKGTNLYETEARSTNNKELHYGEELHFTLANNNINKTIDYSQVATNVIFYHEGEDISGTRSWTWEGPTPDFGKAEAYALTLGSMGKCGAVTNATITTLPAGSYKVYAGIGTTNSSTWTFKYGSTTLGSFVPSPTYAISTFTSDAFTITESTELTVSSSQGKDNSQNWLDYIYIQKLDAIPVSVTEAGYATFSSKYALNFSENGTIKAYKASVNDNKIKMTQVSGNIPAKTGLFLAGTVGTAVNADIPLATSVPNSIEDNILEAHVDEGNVDAGNYVLSGTGTNIAFRKLGSATNVHAGRAYIAGSSIPSGVRTIEVTSDDVTGIQLVPMEPATLTAPTYNLKGMPVSEQTKGIIVRKGKKYINKK